MQKGEKSEKWMQWFTQLVTLQELGAGWFLFYVDPANFPSKDVNIHLNHVRCFFLTCE